MAAVILSKNTIMTSHTPSERYWRSNLKLLGVLLLIWASVSFGAGILLVDFLDQWSMAGFPLGFWMANQGSIYTFVILIAVYVVKMNRLDRQYRHEHPEEIPGESDFEI